MRSRRSAGRRRRGDGGQVDDGVGPPGHAPRRRRPLSSSSSGIRATAALRAGQATRLRAGPPGRHAGPHLVAGGQEGAHQVPPHEAVGAGHKTLISSPRAAPRSASTIIAISSAKSDRRRPAQLLPRASDGSASRRSTSAGRMKARVELHVLLPVEPRVAERQLDQLAHAVGLPGADDEVLRRVALEHAPHRVDVVAGKAPVAARVEVAQPELAWPGRA